MNHFVPLWTLRNLVTLVTLAVLFTTALPPVEAQSGRSPLIRESTAQRHGLTRAWFHRVQMDSGRDRVENITVGDGVLFVQTLRGVISSVDAETGKMHWHRRIGSIDRPTTAVGIGPDHVAVLNGPTLYVMDRVNGNILWSRRTHGAPGAGPAVNSHSVYVVSNLGVLQAYSIHNPDRSAWRYASVGLSDVQPYATERSVAWPTESKFFYVVESGTINPQFRIQTGERIVARPVYIRPFLFVGTLGGHLYKIHERTGSQQWRFAAGAPISSRPLATGEKVFVATETNGVFCLSGKVSDEMLKAAEAEAGQIDRSAAVDGEELWWTPRVTELLAASPTRLYGRDTTGKTLVLRADNGAVVDTLPTQLSDLTVTNDRTDRIYLATREGLIQCLREVALPEPVVHANQIVVRKKAPAGDGDEDDEEFEDEFEDEDDEFVDEDDEGFEDEDDELFE